MEINWKNLRLTLIIGSIVGIIFIAVTGWNQLVYPFLLGILIYWFLVSKFILKPYDFSGLVQTFYMKINWKDFGAMFAIGVVLIVLVQLLFTLLDGEILYRPSLLLISYGIPLMFYFYRNKTELKEAAVVSFYFGFIASIFFNLILILLIIYPLVPTEFAGTFLMPEPIGLLIALFINSIIYAILNLIYGLIIWFALKKLKWEKS